MKPGYKTSEFWVTAVTSLAMIFNQSGLLGSIVLPLEAIGTVAGLLASYIISRGVAKVNAPTE